LLSRTRYLTSGRAGGGLPCYGVIIGASLPPNVRSNQTPRPRSRLKITATLTSLLKCTREWQNSFNDCTIQNDTQFCSQELLPPIHFCPALNLTNRDIETETPHHLCHTYLHLSEPDPHSHARPSVPRWMTPSPNLARTNLSRSHAHHAQTPYNPRNYLILRRTKRAWAKKEKKK
jgi:hypothetical protein